MIDLEYIRSFFSPTIANNKRFDRYMLKEYIQLMILDYITSTKYAENLSFIGGTNLRLVQGIDRFSEDLDFDCKNLSENDFMLLTDNIIHELQKNGINVETRDKVNSNLTAFRRNLYFPQMLFELGLTGHREERFLVKIESQDQGFQYQPKIVNISRMGFFFDVQTPPDDVLCSMKLSALLSRQKGRDFYDSIFLLSKTKPNYEYLVEKQHIANLQELKSAIFATLLKVDLNIKKKDFIHLLFKEENAERILGFGKFVENLE
ncbi:MAG: nucleotidyl transferase AbiEii/AbiGii toxin family protein [Bacteroidales bacterium]|nr:nucleotidyl transferase AbiEii/AbiGii toxin family protein [Bacteroidales bacterium]